MTAYNVPEVSLALRHANPSSLLPWDFHREKNGAGLPKRQPGLDVFDPNRLPLNIVSVATDKDPAERAFDAMGIPTAPYVPRHSLDTSDMAQTGRNPAEVIRMIRPPIRAVVELGEVLQEWRAARYPDKFSSPYVGTHRHSAN